MNLLGFGKAALDQSDAAGFRDRNHIVLEDTAPFRGLLDNL
jgi:hypothetical protein